MTLGDVLGRTALRKGQRIVIYWLDLISPPKPRILDHKRLPRLLASGEALLRSEVRMIDFGRDEIGFGIFEGDCAEYVRGERDIGY